MEQEKVWQETAKNKKVVVAILIVVRENSGPKQSY